MSTQALLRRLDRLARRAETRPVPPIVLIDATGFVDEATYAAFAAADAEDRAWMRAELASLEAALVAEKTADLPGVEGSRVIQAIIVTSRLPEEHDSWRLHADEEAPTPDRQAAIERRDAMIAEAEAEWHREQAAKRPLAERDWDPSGPDHVVLYHEQPSGWPVTRAQHRARLEAMGGRPGSTFDPLP